MPTKRMAIALCLFAGLTFLSQTAQAQGGCFWSEYWGEVDCTICGGTGSQPNDQCTGPFTDGYFCLQGFGTCCDHSFGTTSMVPDPRCSIQGPMARIQLKPKQLLGDEYFQIASLYLPSCQGGYIAFSSLVARRPDLETKTSRQNALDAEDRK